MQTRRRLLSLLLLVPAIDCSPADPPAAPELTKAALTQPPNIIWILVDDQNDELLKHQPRLKSLLVDQGTTFSNSFVSIALCCPSRIATLRGQFGHNSGIFTNNGPDGGFAKIYNDGLESSTAATWLQNAGYRTALVGKYLNGYPTGAPSNTYIPPGWTRWFSPNGGSPYSNYNYDLNENGTTVHYGSGPSDHLVDVIARKTTTFIKNTTAKDAKRRQDRQRIGKVGVRIASDPVRALFDPAGVLGVLGF